MLESLENIYSFGPDIYMDDIADIICHLLQ